MYGISKYCNLCGKKNNLVRSLRVIKRQLSQQQISGNSELAEGYKPEEVNHEINEDYFFPPCRSNQKPFTLILPPPNITGTLHLGHALTSSIQDVLIRWHKMKGIETLWVPGLDHAGIATQVVVEKKIWKEKKLSRHDLGRENFQKEIWKWMSEKSSTIIDQLKMLNVTLNWEKKSFTMDQTSSEVVVETFIRLFEQGLIYRAGHLVNWSCILQSAISDIEIDYMSITGPTHIDVPGYDKPIKFGELTYFAYKIKDSEDEIVVATTRPETIVGDVAVAVNPTDSRYTKFIGKQLYHPFRNTFIPVIADDFVDPEFGTGAVKITPSHDHTDFEVGKRHKLKSLEIIDSRGSLNDLCKEFEGLQRFKARDVIIDELTNRQLYRGRKDHNMKIPICSRSKDVIEFLLKPQWFVKCSTMAENALNDVKSGNLVIEPENFEKMWFHWLENIRDWCISRQLWWGHRIPAYHCAKMGSESREKIWVAAKNEQEAKIKTSKILSCPETEIDCEQDDDVLDTWFSSGLQPLAVLGWLENKEFFKKHYPISLMETGHDILFFWVARMVMLGTQLTGTLPFNKILLHGIICDAHGRKMSKTLGNVIAPEDVINGASLQELKSNLGQSYSSGILTQAEFDIALQGQRKMFPNGIPKCGADALRFTLLSHNIKNHFINFEISECHTNKLFCNKIWQATKFAILWCDKVSDCQGEKFLEKDDDFDRLPLMDKWILSRLSYLIETTNRALESHDFYVATARIKDFFYYEFCDIYLESIKTDFKDQPDSTASKNHCQILLTCLDLGLRILAPFMPVVSQHLHRHLPKFWDTGIDTSFPLMLGLRNEVLEKDWETIMDIVVCIRRLKKIFNVIYKYKPEVYLLPDDFTTVQNFAQVIKDLSHLYILNIPENESFIENRDNLVKDVAGSTRIYLVVPEELMKSFSADHEKMEAKKQKMLKEFEKIKNLISGEIFQEKAPKQYQESQRKKLTVLEEKISRIDTIQKLTSRTP
ncbi:valine--tRNA ligase-like [Sitophilus oryzae]|uniref:valine--tRNA ligase n=1 Tax=Sitophilus oryzae TaxID=7048 RepID=A0A6J2YRG4_SITOR|nr:valine--tRNA ligase-like [Sitophilus oryzae]